MEEITKETVVADRSTPEGQKHIKKVRTASTNTPLTIANLVFFLFGLLEIFLGFRLVFKLLGASTASSFVDFVYGTTEVFVSPFENIFRTATTRGVETTSVLEPAAIIALIVYPLVSWAIVKLIAILSGNPETVE